MIYRSALMPTARAVAGEATAEFPAVPERIASRDPLDAFIDRVRPLAARCVDVLQLAASLEAAGVTDRTARVRYGFSDVFELAGEVYRRVADVLASLPEADRSGLRVFSEI